MKMVTMPKHVAAK